MLDVSVGVVCKLCVFFFFSDQATPEIYTGLFAGSVRCVKEKGVNNPNGPATGFTLGKSKLNTMLFAIKPSVEVAKGSPGNPMSFLVVLLACLECPSCVGAQPILNEALNSPPIFDIHCNLGLGDKIFDVWLLKGVGCQPYKKQHYWACGSYPIIPASFSPSLPLSNW